jgi:hypothetical protein
MQETVYLEKTDTGATLATWIYCGMWQLYSAEKSGLRGYFNWPQEPNRSLIPYQDPAQFAKMPNMFDWYFEQPHFPYPERPQRDKTWIWENCVETGTYPLMAQPLSVIKEFYRSRFRFNQDVIQRGQALVARYSLDFSKLIGVSWRGTDAITDGRPRLPIEVYFPFIDDILAKEPDLRICATAEEAGILDPLLKRYPQAFTIDEFYSSPFGCPQNPERFSPFSGFERGMQPALIMWLFSQCAHYIKNRSSVGFVASWLSTGNIICLAHPQNASGFGFDLTKAEINGEQLVPMVR